MPITAADLEDEYQKEQATKAKVKTDAELTLQESFSITRSCRFVLVGGMIFAVCLFLLPWPTNPPHVGEPFHNSQEPTGKELAVKPSDPKSSGDETRNTINPIQTTLDSKTTVQTYSPESSKNLVGNFIDSMQLAPDNTSGTCKRKLQRRPENALQKRLTVIMATSPRPAGHCILHIRSALRSLYTWLPELYLVTLRIAFDGCPRGQPKFWEATWCDDYVWQKEAVRELVTGEFSHAKIEIDMIVPDTRRAGLGGNLRNTFLKVTTPYVYVIQDDFVHNMHFDVHEVLDTLEVNTAIEYIRLNVLKNGKTGLWDYKSDEVIIGNGENCVKRGLTRGCNWSDNNRFAPSKIYNDILYSMTVPERAPEASFPHDRKSCEKQMKWYLYGALGHESMVWHVDGMYREWNGKVNGPQKRKCPTEEQYKSYLAKQCPMSGVLPAEKRV